ncbi:hypothetical protein TEA_010322 [Camellia sinensis var. sinensis]|uniref:Tetraspanin-8-like n=1 Tax=Camellia sinensis var. sinensis TaxID=542762 RepID=A0A4S4DPV1_CAMSN|nr:hypothetical protein TEA_010322 [Camellia sinensis var. sinensis]
MFKLSNNLIGILNFLTFLFSIPILWAGIWLSRQGSTDCEKFLEKPLIAIGIVLMVVSLAGLIGACCRVSWLLWFYLLVMFLLILLLFCFTIFAFVVTNKGAGEALSGKGYKEYRLGDYSNWLQKRVNSTKNWTKIKSCLQDGKVCQSLIDAGSNTTVTQFYLENLSSVQMRDFFEKSKAFEHGFVGVEFLMNFSYRYYSSFNLVHARSGCCKPSNDCNFTYISPTNWTTSAISSYTNSDCKLWNNDPSILCFDCQSCKAGLLDSIKHDWKKVAVINIIFLVILVIVYSIGCCAFRNNREHNFMWKRRP